MDIDIPHSLGRDEAKRRVEAGLPKLEKHIPGGGTVSAIFDTYAPAIGKILKAAKIGADHRKP